MSALYLLALFFIWLFAGWIIYRLWKRWKPKEEKRKPLHTAVGLLILFAWLGGTFWEVAGEKMYWDAKVRKWCAKDGGIVVHETVVLPPEQYEWYAKRNWVLPIKSKATPSDEYFWIVDITYYHRSDPQVFRDHTQIVRLKDVKVLGEYISYWRGGGDLPGPWMGSSFSCYDITKKPSNFSKSIFIKGDNNGHDQ